MVQSIYFTGTLTTAAVLLQQHCWNNSAAATTQQQRHGKRKGRGLSVLSSPKDEGKLRDRRDDMISLPGELFLTRNDYSRKRAKFARANFLRKSPVEKRRSEQQLSSHFLHKQLQSCCVARSSLSTHFHCPTTEYCQNM